MADFIVSVLVIAFVIVVLGLLGWASYDSGNSSGYVKGYCAALHGTPLNGSQCNVNGRVVEVTR